MNADFSNPSLEQIKSLLQQIKHIAVVGLSPKTARPSHQVAKAMQGYGYHIIPVRPAVAEVL
ncbi:MAG: CoA-binding protein, partial [Thiohalomonadales bacterium]|nr:CoA-binding protein [Thiohalomonadales bacterium]